MNGYRFKRGDLCRKITKEEQKNPPTYFLVMRVIDDERMLVVPIYEKCDAWAINWHLSDGIYRVKFSAVHTEKQEKFEAVTDVRINCPRECVSAVYEKSKNYNHDCRVRAMERKRQERIMAKQFKELRRLREFDLRTHVYEPVPASVSRYARCPLQGGAVNPR